MIDPGATAVMNASSVCAAAHALCKFATSICTAACPVYATGALQTTSVQREPLTVLNGWILSYSSYNS